MAKIKNAACIMFQSLTGFTGHLAQEQGAVSLSRPVRSPTLRLAEGRERLRDVLRRSERSGEDLLLERLRLLYGVLRHLAVHRRVADAIVGKVEAGKVVSILALFRVRSDVIHGHIDALEGAGNHIRVDVALIRVYTDAVDVVLISSVESADTTAAGHLEDDVGMMLADLALRHRFAKRGVGEVIRVVDQNGDGGIHLLGAVLESGNIARDRRNRLAANSANGVSAEQSRDFGFPVYFHLSGNGAHQTTRLLLFEEQWRDIGQRLTSPGRGIWHGA